MPANGRFTGTSTRRSGRRRPSGPTARSKGPNGFLNESYTVTCTAPDGTLLETNHITVDRGQSANMSLCTQGGVGGTVPATLSLTFGPPARSTRSRRA